MVYTIMDIEVYILYILIRGPNFLIQILLLDVNPQNQACLEGCVTPKLNFCIYFILFIYLKTIFMFLWLITFQTSPVHCLH